MFHFDATWKCQKTKVLEMEMEHWVKRVKMFFSSQNQSSSPVVTNLSKFNSKDTRTIFVDLKLVLLTVGGALEN